MIPATIYMNIIIISVYVIILKFNLLVPENEGKQKMKNKVTIAHKFLILVV